MAGLGVLHDTRFSFGSAGIIRYIDDPDKVIQVEIQKEVNTYINYMDNPEKSKGLFDATGDYITAEERDQYVSYFKETEKNEGLLWQDLFSFKNEWLAEHGLMNLETNEVDDKRLMHAVTCAMDSLITSEGLQNYKWIGAMHHNTDNRHFHIAGVELTPSRPYKWHNVYKKDKQGNPLYDSEGHRLKEDYQVYQPTGYRQKKSLEKMKSVFVNQLIRSADKLQQIDAIARQEVIQRVNTKAILSPKATPYFQEISAIYLKLPTDKRLWNMKNAKEHFFYKEVSTLTDAYLATDFKAPYQHWKKEVGALANEYNTAYTTFEVDATDFVDPRMKNYVKDKETDLKRRIGNAVLSQLKELDKVRSTSGLNRKHFLKTLLNSAETEAPERIQKAYTVAKNGEESQPFLKKKSPYSDDDVSEKLVHLPTKAQLNRADLLSKNRQVMTGKQKGLSREKPTAGRPYQPFNSGADRKQQPSPTQKKSPQSASKSVKKVRVVLPKKQQSPQLSAFTNKRFAQRYRQNKAFYHLRTIESNMKKASTKWQDKMAYEQLENEIIQTKSHTH